MCRVDLERMLVCACVEYARLGRLGVVANYRVAAVLSRVHK